MCTSPSTVEQRERRHLEDQEGPGDPGVRADVEARRHGGEHDHDQRGRERVEPGDRDAEVVGDAEREDRDDQRQRDEADEERGDAEGRAEHAAHERVVAAGDRIPRGELGVAEGDEMLITPAMAKPQNTPVP